MLPLLSRSVAQSVAAFCKSESDNQPWQSPTSRLDLSFDELVSFKTNNLANPHCKQANDPARQSRDKRYGGDEAHPLNTTMLLRRNFYWEVLTVTHFAVSEVQM